MQTEYTFSLEASVLDRVMPLKKPQCVPTLQRYVAEFNLIMRATAESFNEQGINMAPMALRGTI